MDDILKLLLISDWWREVSRGESRAVIGQNKTGVKLLEMEESTAASALSDHIL